MPLTKQGIDALWDAHRKRISGSVAMNREDTYLAAGLTAEGERKPERVRCWIYGDSSGKCLTMVEPSCGESRWKFTPGWFVPSEEGET